MVTYPRDHARSAGENFATQVQVFAKSPAPVVPRLAQRAAGLLCWSQSIRGPK
jgi:hypothetical protein